MNQLITPDRLL